MGERETKWVFGLSEIEWESAFKVFKSKCGFVQAATISLYRRDRGRERVCVCCSKCMLCLFRKRDFECSVSGQKIIIWNYFKCFQDSPIWKLSGILKTWSKIAQKKFAEENERYMTLPSFSMNCLVEQYYLGKCFTMQARSSLVAETGTESASKLICCCRKYKTNHWKESIIYRLPDISIGLIISFSPKEIQG